MTGCTSAQNTEPDHAKDESKHERLDGKERPYLDEIFTKMDATKDGKLEAIEVRGLC